ncbi:uncharacterized protein N7500_004992 [Penicillium coprophilum]|uniref:uncharacterized protein n=1 Tax=Penicillium coprophilum TaxID=36646 RepID=UPI0023973584|nr:uncharacterized protein N7500_004992 [Penicillium coprophilum]KAJ5163162.1 hypothetical protein N7500_004992 [Penicillium coprophilum]
MMFENLVSAFIFASLNSIGIWHSVPYTGINPSNSFFWRGLGSLEIAWSIHELRKAHPFIFPHDDAISEYDLLLKLALDAQQYENARLALEQSAEAASLQLNIPEVTASMFDPNAIAIPSPVHLNESAANELRYEELQQPNPAQTNGLSFYVLATLFLITLLLQLMAFVKLGRIQSDTEDLKNNCYDLIKGVLEQFGALMIQIQHFRKENEQVRPVFVHLAEEIRNASEDLQRCFLHLVGTMEDKYTSGMIDLDTKLEEVSQQHQGLLKNTQNFPQIPRQLAWLNILMSKTMYNDVPDELRAEQPIMDLNESLTTGQTNPASKCKTAENAIGVITSNRALGLGNGEEGSVRRNAQGLA